MRLAEAREQFPKDWGPGLRPDVLNLDDQLLAGGGGDVVGQGAVRLAAVQMLQVAVAATLSAVACRCFCRKDFGGGDGRGRLVVVHQPGGGAVVTLAMAAAASFTITAAVRVVAAVLAG